MSFEGKVSTLNSTNTPLGIDGVFQGKAETTLNYGYITIQVFADQDSATDGLSIEQSIDGVNWDKKETHTISANIVETYAVQLTAEFFQINYINGSVAQGAFRLQVIKKKFKLTEPAIGGGVDSVAGKTGVVTLAINDTVGLQTALDLKMDSGNLGLTGVVIPDTTSIATINVDPTKFDIPPVSYLIDGTPHLYVGATSIDPQYQAGSNVVLVGLDVNGLVLIDEIAYGQSEWKDETLDTVVPIARLQAAAGNVGPGSTISQIRPDHYQLKNWFTKDRIYHQGAVGATYDLAPNSGKIVRSVTTGQVNQLVGRLFDQQRKPVTLPATENLIAVQFTGVTSPFIVIAVPFIAYDKYSADFGVSLTASTISFTAPDTITDSASGFLTEGFKVGDLLSISGSANNESTTHEIQSVTADTITVLSGIVNESLGPSITITSYMRNLDPDNYASHFIMRPTGVTSNYFIKLSPQQYSTRDEALAVEFQFGYFGTAQVVPIARVIMQSGNDEIDTIFDERPLISRQRPLLISQGITNLADFANGCFLESPQLWIESDGVVVKAKINNASGGSVLNVQFNGLNFPIDVTTPAEIVLTQGTDSSPVDNYIYYILVNTTPILTVSTTGYPTTSHAKIGVTTISSASFVQTYRPLKTWTHTDDIRWHLQHINEALRGNAKYESGIDSTTTIVTQTTLDDVFLSNTSGYAAQLHKHHPFPVIDMQTGDAVFIANHPTTAYTVTTNLNTQLLDANNVSLSTNRFNMVKWAAVSEDSMGNIDSKIFVNLPNGSYTNDADAINDINNTAIKTVPQIFRGVAILLERITFRHSKSGANETWTLLNTEDLRGQSL